MYIMHISMSSKRAVYNKSKIIIKEIWKALFMCLIINLLTTKKREEETKYKKKKKKTIIKIQISMSLPFSSRFGFFSVIHFVGHNN